MPQITYLNFLKDSKRINYILFTIFIFSGIMYFTKNDNFYNKYESYLSAGNINEYFIATGFYSMVCILANYHFKRKATKMFLNPEVRMNWFEREILKSALITILGIGTLYLFFVEGLYGIYLLFKSFSWGALIIRIAIIIIMGYKLAVSVANVQDSLKQLSQNTWD